jgi:hypothetical protein
VLDRILHRGVSLEGNLTIGLADVDLLYLDLRLLLAAVDTVWPAGRPAARAVPGPEHGPPPAPLPDRDDKPAVLRGDLRTTAGREPTAPPPAGVTPSTPAAGLVRLVLTLVRLLHEVLERLAVRRMEGGNLSPREIVNVGAALLAQAVEVEALRRQFGFTEGDLALPVGLFRRPS